MYKRFKDLRKESLRDRLSDPELLLNMLAETSATSISRTEQPQDLEGNRQATRQGGRSIWMNANQEQPAPAGCS